MVVSTAWRNLLPQPSTIMSWGSPSVTTGNAPSAPVSFVYVTPAAEKLAAGTRAVPTAQPVAPGAKRVVPVQTPVPVVHTDDPPASTPKFVLPGVIVRSPGHGRRLLATRNA